ncbi:MAG: sulfotransferase domain-containing protein [Gemmatimonadota bacterium]
MRLPDFIVIGTMKSGTTSLFRWLEVQPECVLPRLKGIDFFTRDENWRKGVHWYSEFFSMAPEEALTGEASPSCTHPDLAPKAARRMAGVVPDVRLIVSLRNPVERLRAQYRHDLQRGRETRSFVDAVADANGQLVQRSLYWKVLQPYIELFPREQICVVRFEDLVKSPFEGWSDILRFLGLENRPSPGIAYNVTSQKPQFTKTLFWLWQSGWPTRLDWLPRPMRRLGKKLLTRADDAYVQIVDSAGASVPGVIFEQILNDAALLEGWLGVAHPLWPELEARELLDGRT